jgi:hypothetical protein
MVKGTNRMAHKFRIKPVPHKNKDGSDSKSKFDYHVLDRTRQGTRVVGVATTKKAAEELVEVERQRLIGDHVKRHPNDQSFRNKLYADGAK